MAPGLRVFLAVCIREHFRGQDLPRAQGCCNRSAITKGLRVRTLSPQPGACCLILSSSAQPCPPPEDPHPRASARFTRVRPLQNATSTQLLRVEGPTTQSRGGCDLWALLGKGAGGWVHRRTCRNLRKTVGSLFLLRAPGFWHLGIPQCPTFKAVNSESFRAFPAAALDIMSTLPVTPPNPMFPHSLPGILQI